jgi:hypothetical protein
MRISTKATGRCSRSRATTRDRANREGASRAAKRGLDPDKWFNNVEIVVSERIGIETTTYVRNIYKCYVGYWLLVEAQAEREKARQQLAPAKS